MWSEGAKSGMLVEELMGLECVAKVEINLSSPIRTERGHEDSQCPCDVASRPLNLEGLPATQERTGQKLYGASQKPVVSQISICLPFWERKRASCTKNNRQVKHGSPFHHKQTL